MSSADASTNWTVAAGERRCLVAVACSERMIHRDTVKSLIRLSWGGAPIMAARKHGFKSIEFAWFDKGVRVDALRNQATKQAIAEGFSHLLFLDADMVWPDDVLDRMLAHHARGIVAGIYFLKSWPYWVVALRNPQANERYGQHYDYDWQAAGATELRREHLVGMGCTLIPVALLRRMDAPHFFYKNDADGQPSITEDVAFCEQAVRLNCPIWLDPTIECGHVSIQTVTTAWFHRGLVEHQTAIESAQQSKGSAA